MPDSPARFLLAPVDFMRSSEAIASSWTEEQALGYTRWLATRHYENFHVVSFLLPKHLHQDLYNVYSFCRWADDLGDEIGDTQESLRLLDWWRDQLIAMYAGHATHPVFVALRQSVEKFHLPIDPFDDLIAAFKQDQVITRYRTWDQLFGYCRNSANPCGRLVLYLFGYADETRQKLSDATCTALQLANFWQDVAVDLDKDRVYLPAEVMETYGYTLEDLYARKYNAAFESVMADVCGMAHNLFEQGLPLADMVDRRLAIDLELFSQGGLKILSKIEKQNYDVLSRRPAITKVERFALLVRVFLRRRFGAVAAA